MPPLGNTLRRSLFLTGRIVFRPAAEEIELSIHWSAHVRPAKNDKGKREEVPNLEVGLAVYSDFTTNQAIISDPIDLAISMDSDLRLLPLNITLTWGKCAADHVRPLDSQHHLKVIQATFYHRPLLISWPVGQRLHLEGTKLQAAKLAIGTLSEKRSIWRLQDTDNSKGFYSRVFLVPNKNSQDIRMIIDLKLLNKYFLVAPPKSDGINFRIFRMEDWLISLDLQDAHLHVPIHQALQKYLRFAVNGRISDFQVFWAQKHLDSWLPSTSFIRLHLHSYVDDFHAADQDRSQPQQNMPLLEFLTHSAKSEDIVYIGACF